MLQDVLQKIDADIGNLFQRRLLGVLTKEEITFLENLEDRKRHILLKEEELYRLRSKALWLQQEDNNTIFFHNYANYRKSVNTI